MWSRMVMRASLLGLLALGPPLSAAAERDINPAAKAPPSQPILTGEYWALLIGIDQYRHAPKLQTAVRDATAVREVLLARYGFRRERIIELLDAQATRENIFREIDRLGRMTGKDDSVLIYYAGHGEYDEEQTLGWWVPVDGNPQDPAPTYITNASIRDYVRAMKAKHVYLVADSCFSGKLLGRSSLMPKSGLTPAWIARQAGKRSRWALTSGGTEPVADEGKAGHSVFAYHFLNVLQENQQPYLLPRQIIEEVGNLVANNARQTPRSAPIQDADDEGGQFVFRLASASPTNAAPQVGEGRVGAALSQAEQELKTLEEQEREVEERKKLAKLQQQIEEKKKKLELAKGYGLPPQQGRELTGRDGAPMALIPAGEFLYGRDNQRLSLPAFYMDKYEVTTTLYAAFLAATGRKEPGYWQTSVPVSQGRKPVVGVTWHDAEAYCRYYGKRLPTEQEWEKAARGTDGRRYPWGHEAPTSRHAKYDVDGKASWQGYETLATVDSYEAGKSPYGLYHMAGNVWEWTSSDYDQNYKVIRGGSWGSGAYVLGSTNRDRGSPDGGGHGRGFRCAQDAR
jgi:formylglycine-generating enzyme required for sulfatase activity